MRPDPLTPPMVAELEGFERFGGRPPSRTNTRRALIERGLVRRTRFGDDVLTDAGWAAVDAARIARARYKRRLDLLTGGRA